MRSHITRACSSRRSGGGWITIEMTAALVILGILLVSLVRTQQNIGKLNALQLAKMRCIAAGQAELDSIAATGRGMDESERARLWPEVRLEVEKSPGEGQWTGLRLIEVTAVGKAGGQVATAKLARYVAAR